MKTSLWDALPRFLLTWLVSVALDAGLGEFLHLDCRWWLAALVLLLWCAALAAAERFDRFWGMPELWAVGFGLCLALSDRALLVEAARAAVSRAGGTGGYGELCLLLFCATVALPLSALLRFYWARAALSLGWAALWIASALLEWSMPRIVPAALAPLLLSTLVETLRQVRRDPQPSAPLLRALLLSLLPAALLLMLLPTPAEPYDYPFLRSVAERVEQLWHETETSLRFRREGDRQFDLSFNGASDDAELGDLPQTDKPHFIYAKPQLAPDGAIYLFGNAWNRFDGHSWSSSLSPEAAKQLNWGLDAAEHAYALWRLLRTEGTEAVFSDFFRPNSVYLSYRGMNVRTMFTVMNALHIQTDAERFPYADAPTGSLFDFIQRDETWYRIYYLEPNVRTLGALITASEGTAYDAETRTPIWYTVEQDLNPGVYSDLKGGTRLEETFAARAEMIRDLYLNADGVSDRARALAEEITAGCGGDYEKLRAIAAYLQTNYRYTLSPDVVPASENFLDWLLFKGQEGYCTWYATAATLLARSVGVPARYVQGYRGKLAAAVFTPLGPECAHAWCEGYVAGYGWVTVEATPGFSNGGTGWLTAAEEQALRADQPTTEAIPDDMPLPEPDEGRADQPAPGSRNDAVETLVPEPGPAPARRGWLKALIPLALLAALLALRLGVQVRRRRRYAKADGATKLRLDLEQLLRDLRSIGYPRQPEESLRQYFARLPWRYLPADEDEAQAMAALYDRTFFALAQPSAEEVARHRDFAARLRPRTLWQRVRRALR